jgi:quinolinate synthase
MTVTTAPARRPGLADSVPLDRSASWSPDRWAAWRDEVRRLATEWDAVILAHNYQPPQIQDVAHHVGDSLALSRLAASARESTIVFAGVHFMAETAKILSPDKTVLIPTPPRAARWPTPSPPTSCGPGRPSTPGRWWSRT